MELYADSNFITRLYLERPETPNAELMLSEARAEGLARLPITWLLRIETINAFEQSVFVSRSAGRPRVTPEQASIARTNFLDDLNRRAFLHTSELSLVTLLDRAERLALRYTAKHGFRTYDLLHVASALALECGMFWSFDERARKLARLEGLKTN